MRKDDGMNQAVTEIVGTILLLGIAVSLFSIVYVAVFSIPQSQSTPEAIIVGSIDFANEELVFEHRGGDVLPGDAKLIVHKGGSNVETSIQSYVGDEWVMGEQLVYPIGPVENVFVEAFIVDTRTNSMVSISVLQKGLSSTSPVVQTKQVENIGKTTAKLKMTYDFVNYSGTVYFRYQKTGTSWSAENTTDPYSPGDTFGSYSEEVLNLEENTAYVVQAVLTYDGNIIYGVNKSFTTASIPLTTMVDPIIPYSIAAFPLQINATGDSRLDNVTLFYRFSADNFSADSNNWWNYSWNYRKSHMIERTTGADENYQIKIQVINGSGVDTGHTVYISDKARGDFNDIRFISYVDNQTELDYWAEEINADDSATFWVKLTDNLTNGDSIIWLYYGNSVANSKSNGDNTFIFFDDFSDNLSKWTIHKTSDGYPRIENGYLVCGGGRKNSTYGHTVLGSSPEFSDFKNGVIEANIYQSKEGIAEVGFRGDYADNSGYKGRWDCRNGDETPWMKPPYQDWVAFGNSVTRFGIEEQWQKIKLVINNNDFEIYSNDILKSSVSDSEYFESGEISLQNHYGDYTYFDDVRVRKYVSPEPIQGSWGEEESNPNPSWWNTAFGFRKVHTVDQTPGADINYQINLTVFYGAGTDVGNQCFVDGYCQPDFDDIRFVSYIDNVTLFDYWVEEVNPSVNATFWINIPYNLSEEDVLFWVYYGNQSVQSSSDAPSTFYKYINFSEYEIENLSSENSGDVEILDQGKTLHTWNNSWRYIDSSVVIERNGSLRLDFDMSSVDTGDVQGIGISDENQNIQENHTYQFAGSESSSDYLSPNKSYSGIGGDWQKVFTVLDDFTGFYPYLVFANDDETNNGDCQFRNVRIRKYTSPEPTHGSWGSQQEFLDDTGWQKWDNVLNPDVDGSDGWNWMFTFPDGNGFYEFFSRGAYNDQYEDTAEDADARCKYNGG